jgi:type IV secretion system protein VirB4
VVAELDLKGFTMELKVISARAQTISELEHLIDTVGPEPATWLPLFMGEQPPPEGARG